MALFIGIDSGTQGTKAVVLDIQSQKVVARARAPHALIQGLPPGHMEQHPATWIQALESVLDAVAGQIDRTRVRGIGISGQQHGLVALDASRSVIRPAKLWCDTSTVAECAWLTKKLGGEKSVIHKSGLPFRPGYTAPKILWLKRHEPRNYRRLRHVLLPHDYLNFYLTGNLRMEFGDASGTALMDVRRRRWSQPVIEAIDRNLGDWLPALASSREPAGILSPVIARRYSFPPDAIVSAGGGDNMMGAIGTGNVKPGMVTASFGTSGTIYAYSEKPVVDTSGDIAAFCSSTGGWLPLVCTMNVTNVTEQTRALLGCDHAAFDAAVLNTPSGAGGLVLLPYFTGERTPNLPTATGVLFGLKHGSLSAGCLARAAMEGVTFSMNYGLQRLRKLGIKPKEIRVTGGGSKSPAWRQIMADIFGVPVVAMAEEEGAALGAAVQAAWSTANATGRAEAKIAEFTEQAVAPVESTRCLPNRRRVAHYAEVQATHDALSLALRDLFASSHVLLNKSPT